MNLSSGRKPVHTTWPFKVANHAQEQHSEFVLVSNRGRASDPRSPLPAQKSGTRLTTPADNARGLTA